MKKIIFVSFIVFVFMCPSVSKAEEMVTVRLVNYIGDTSELTIQLIGEHFLLDPTLQLKEGVNYKLKVKNGKITIKGASEVYVFNGSFALIPQKYNEDHQIIINDRPYIGAMEFIIENHNYIRPVNQLPLEDYLKGVIPLEVFPSWDIEALKAQSLAARTYAVSHLSETMDDTTFYQVYGGYVWNQRTTKAVEETKDEVITYKNQLIEAFYSASNGGMTESNVNVWGGQSMSFYPVKKDPYDPIHPWSYHLQRTQVNLEEIEWSNSNWWDSLIEEKDPIITSIKKWINRQGYPGDIIILSIPTFELSSNQFSSKRSVKGSVEVEFLQRLSDGTVLFGKISLLDVNLNRIRPMIGGNIFKSYLIDSLEFNNGKYTMKGRGYGHGVGMSQWGASKMGESGKTYKEIIEFYFPGTHIMKFSDYKK